jgi:hypothetical protein
LLASCPDGCTESIMLAHRFTIPQMVELVRAGLATAERRGRGLAQVRGRASARDALS